MVVTINNEHVDPRGYGADLLAAGATVAARDLPDWLEALKLSALAAFERQGFPRRDEEAWRFTDISDIVENQFVPQELAGVSASSDALEAARQLLEHRLPDLGETARLVFVDGVLEPSLSRLGSGRDNFVVSTLGSAIHEHPDLVRALLGKDFRNGFVALNTLMFQSGSFIRLKRAPGRVVEEKPVVHLIHVATQRNTPLAYHPRNLVLADTGSEGVVIETYLGAEGATYLVNGLTQVDAGAGSSLDHVIVQEESTTGYHLQELDVRTAAGTRFASYSVALGALRSRLDINATLEQDGGDVSLRGVYVGRGAQHVDHHTLVTHLGRHSSSQQNYRGVLDDQAKGVFDGLIHVAPDAQKTVARQSTRNLLLSGRAVVHAQPRLEINADDVQCAHGATIGELEPEALFYLQSRGIDREEARKLLIQAFLDDVIDAMPHPQLKTFVAQRVRSRLEVREGGNA